MKSKTSQHGGQNVSKFPLGASWGALGALLAALGGLSGRFWDALGGSWAPGWPPGGSREAPRRPKWSPKGLRMSPRRRQAFEKAPENSWEHRGGKENARRARAAREQGPHAKAAHNIAGSSAKRRNTACTTAKPPQGPENSLHHRQATGKHRTTAPRTFASTAFSDSAFRFLSRQVTESGRSARL